MVINKCLVGLLVFLFQAVGLHKGTSSFMTSALDALVFVKVCNLWWASDKVPQGRGVAPVQLLSRITLDSMTRMSNLQTLTGNSSKYLSAGSAGLLRLFHCMFKVGRCVENTPLPCLPFQQNPFHSEDLMMIG